MITAVDLHLSPGPNCEPFAAVKGNGRYRFYKLTRASANRFARLLNSFNGSVHPSGTGWLWIRKEAE